MGKRNVYSPYRPRTGGMRPARWAELRRAFKFFMANAGYATPPGRAACALELARAEAWAAGRDLQFVWESDAYGDLGDHAYWCDTARRGNAERCDHAVEACILYRPCADHGVDCKHAEVLASLSGIIDADSDYRRVVQAELASKAMHHER